MPARFINYFIIFLYLFSYLQAASLDGTSSLKYQSTPYVLRDTDTVTGYVRFANGFTIIPAPNHASSATLDTCISCSGGFDLQGTSTLKLTGDLILDSATTLTNSGTIYGYNRTLKLKGNLTINANQVLHLDGNLIIDGQGHDIFINEHAQLLLDHGATVTIKNATIHNKRNAPGWPAFTMTTSLCRLTISDVELALDSDLYINNGQLFIHNDVAVTGTSALIWHSIAPCTIEPNSNLYFDVGTTFSYAPPCTDKNLIRMTDQSSTLHLNGCSLLATHTGLRLTQGTVLFDNRVILDSAATNKLDSLTTATQLNFGTQINTLKWSPDGKYLAIGGNYPLAGNELQIYSFNGSTLTAVIAKDYGTGIYSVNWSPDGKYLAIGGTGPAAVGGFSDTNELRVYSFDGTTLTAVTSQDYGSLIFSVSWSPDGKYLAVGGNGPTTFGGAANSNELQIYRFNGKALLPVTSQDYGTEIWSTAWTPDGKYIAISGMTPAKFGGVDNTNEVQVYRFDGSTLTAVTSQDYGTRVRHVTWSPDGKYLAVCGDTPALFGGVANTDELQIYSFNGTALSPAGSLNYGAAGSAIYVGIWSPTGRYLVYGGYAPANNNEIQICSYDGTTPTLLTSKDYGVNFIYTDWSSDGKYIAVGGQGPTDVNELIIYTVNYLNETATQAVTNGIIFGNGSAGATQDATVKVLTGAQIVVNGILNIDAA